MLNKKNDSLEKGFSLIELMIVIVIIGIMSAIAMPIYLNYTARTQVSEAIGVTTGLQNGISTFIADKGRWPASGSLSTASLAGKYFPQGGVTITGGGEVQVSDTSDVIDGNRTIIHVKFDKGANIGEGMSIKPILADAKTKQIRRWVCDSSTHQNAIAIPMDKLPSGCK